MEKLGVGPCASRYFSGGGVQLVWKRRDVFDQLPGLLVHAPEVAAIATVVVNARVFAEGRQEPDPLADRRRTLDTSGL